MRIDSPPRAIAVLASATLAVLALGFLIGRAIANSSPEPAAAAQTAAYNAGFRRGQAAAAARPTPPPAPSPPPKPRAGRPPVAVTATPDLHPGSSYVVKVRVRSRSGGVTIGPHVLVRPGYSYTLCNGGAAICERPSP